MNEKPEFVLFFMKEDKFCNSFLSKLRTKQELIKKFNLVDIDSVPVLPDEVDEVPCVYDGKQVYAGTNAFKWLDEKMLEHLSPANDGLSYSFINGQEETLFNNYSLLDQKNGCFGMNSEQVNSDPTRMTAMNDNTNKNRSLESLMASRSSDIEQTGVKPPNLNKF